MYLGVFYSLDQPGEKKKSSKPWFVFLTSNCVPVCVSRPRRVNPSSTPWRNAPTGCTLRSSTTASACRSTRAETRSATSAAASSRFCLTKSVFAPLGHPPTTTQAHTDSQLLKYKVMSATVHVGAEGSSLQDLLTAWNSHFLPQRLVFAARSGDVWRSRRGGPSVH